MARESRRATYEDLKRLPDHVVGEILDGELVVSPRPASPHGHAASLLGTEVTGPFHRQSGAGGPGGWWIIDEPELHLHGDVVVPDIAGWRRERMPRMPAVPAFELPPDWVCEIISPRTGRRDRTIKTKIYAREGVSFLWFVEPILKTLETYRLEGKQWLQLDTFGGNEKVRAVPFDAIELDLERLWLPDDEPTPPT